MAWRTATLLLGVLLTWSQGTTATSSEATVVVTLREISRYQASSLPVLDITTPETHYPIAFSHPNKPLPSCTKNETRSTTPYPEPSHWTSHICHNTTITYTLYQSTSTSTASSSRYCTSNSTTTVTVPWPSIGMGHRPSVTGGAQPPYNNGTYHSPSTSTKPPPYRTGMPTDSIRSFELEPEMSSESVQWTYEGETPTPTSTATPEPETEPEPSSEAAGRETTGGSVPPATSASSNGPEEPLFTSRAVRHRSGMGIVFMVGAMGMRLYV